MDSTSIKELSYMMETSDMKQFCTVAEALVERDSKDAYEVLKKYMFSPDIYKKRYILSIIFEYAYAMELAGELEKILMAKDVKIFMVTTILEILIKYNIKINADTVIRVLKNEELNDGWFYLVIGLFDKTEENLKKLLELYQIKGKCTSIRISMAEQLFHYANTENYMALFQLFAQDEQANIRIVACKIARQMERQDLLVQFKDDRDGHIRKYVNESCEFI